jgi:RimJ/RimL family protein N-acetyltransferase
VRILGDRVLIRDFEPADLDVWRGWLLPAHEWQRWDAPWLAATPQRADALVSGVQRTIGRNARITPRRRAVIADSSDEALIGTVARYTTEAGDAAIGIDLYDPAYWGRGLGAEAFRLWCGYVFETAPHFERLVVQTWSGNERMLRLAARYGFSEIERRVGVREVDGQSYDALSLAVDRATWEAAS